MRARVLLLTVCVWLSACESMLFFPMTQMVRVPADVGLRYRDLTLTAQDGVELHAWWLPAEGQARATVVFAHGNAENISTHLASVYWLPKQGVNVLLLDYRGYGLSQGQPTVDGAIEDIQFALDTASRMPEAAGQPLLVLGQSLGASLSGVAVARGGTNTCERLQRWPQLRGVVLDAGFASYSQIAREVAARSALTYLFQWPAAWAMPDGADLVTAVAELAPLPVMVIQGSEDNVVEARHARAIYAAAGEPKRLLEYDGGHIATFSFPENRKQLMAFIQDVSRGESLCTATAPE